MVLSLCFGFLFRFFLNFLVNPPNFSMISCCHAFQLLIHFWLNKNVSVCS